MRCIALVLLSSFAVGCAHFTQPAPTPMVEVTDGSIVPGPPAAQRETPGRPMSRRRALLITGGVIAGIGAVLTIAGGAAYARGLQQQADSEAACAHSDVFLCGVGDAFDTLPGIALLGTGIPHLVSGLVITFVGVGSHD